MLPESVEQSLHDDMDGVLPHSLQEFEDDFVHPLRDGAVKYVRFSAYASDVGEAFRPIWSPAFVRAGYAISIGYVLADVAYAGYRERQEPGATARDVAMTTAHAAVFQTLASLALPFAVIHGMVNATKSHVFHSGSRFSVRLRHWGPAACGLAMIPLLPLLDHPIECAVDWVFDHVQPHRRESDGAMVSGGDSGDGNPIGGGGGGDHQAAVVAAEQQPPRAEV